MDGVMRCLETEGTLQRFERNTSRKGSLIRHFSIRLL